METKYQIEVSALGYDTTATIVLAESLKQAKKSEHKAIAEWLSHNDVDRSAKGFARVHYSLIN